MVNYEYENQIDSYEYMLKQPDSLEKEYSIFEWQEGIYTD